MVHELRKATVMMGKKERSFAPLINVSLEELVPPDHFYRHLERTLDLSFVREFVHESYAALTMPESYAGKAHESPSRGRAGMVFHRFLIQQ